MEFPTQLIPARLIKRYKRFLADVELDSGELITVHCPNTGAMSGCAEPGRHIWLSVSDSKTRKYPHTWELIDTGVGMACVHSARANAVVSEAVESGLVTALGGYATLKREVKYGAGSRADMVLEGEGVRCVVEVKSVTLLQSNGIGAFPDAVSTRARKHLQELQAVVESGERAVIFFCVLHQGIEQVVPAWGIDPAYGEALEAALAAGVEAMAWSADVTPSGITLQREIPFLLR